MSGRLRTPDAGVLWGSLAILLFSLSLPATRAAAPALGGVLVGLGRGAAAGLLAVLYLAPRGELIPPREHRKQLVLVALSTVIAFPLLASVALKHLPASHAMVFTGLTPAATALMGVLRTGDRPAPRFWLACGAGIAAVLLFGFVEGAGRLHPADLLMLGAVTLVAYGYAEGARLSRELGGVRVVSWSLLTMLPVTAGSVVVILLRDGIPAAPAAAWIGFLYVAAFSSFVGYFPWYRGLSLGGVARVGQLQLAQPVLGMLWAGLLLGEPLRARTLAVGLLVIATAALAVLPAGRRSPDVPRRRRWLRRARRLVPLPEHSFAHK
jgi:drug/metabolite transporter (DMT)-like permease